MRPKERLHWIQHVRFPPEASLDGDVPFMLRRGAPEGGKQELCAGGPEQTQNPSDPDF